MSSTLKYIFSGCLAIASLSVHAQTDSTTADTARAVKYKELAGHQLTIGVDISQPIINALVDYRTGYEFAADYYLKKEVYLVAESGWGSAKVNYDDLKYTTNNSFFRIGINKCLLQRTSPSDWDMVFMGVRYGMAFINRSPATYNISDTLWGNSTGMVPGKTFSGYWIEVTGGMRVELVKGLFAGWNIRGRFLMNSGDFKDLAPLYIAGYGKGDKNAICDFNLYLNYAIRWRRKHP